MPTIMQDLQYAKNDSDRFGLVVYRAREEGIDSNMLMQQIMEHNVDTAIVRIRTTLLSQVHKLEKTAMPYQITDTLAYYHLDLTTYKPQALINRTLQFKEAEAEDYPGLHLLVRETFGKYVNHYRMNPFMDNEQVTEGYLDWVLSYTGGHPERKCFVVKDGEQVVAFATFNLEHPDKVKSILCGVTHTHRRRGLYHDLLTYGKNFAKESGKSYMRSICQIENIAVQRSLTRQGFELHHTENTIHINAMLSKSVFEPLKVEIVLKEEEIQGKTANNRILSEINDLFDKQQKMVTANHRFVNVSRMMKAGSYLMTFTFPMGSKCLLRVTDALNQTYVLVYFDLKHFLR
ncbi:GNAT family N-acetyltransferase [Algivirga pacifica]|uniref:N-acetyltransferase domain-containing protein n=1 Tax=Algivirga pacifica TaxID=1162670 RepID=A0ABP9D6A1_9BACT